MPDTKRYKEPTGTKIRTRTAEGYNRRNYNKDVYGFSIVFGKKVLVLREFSIRTHTRAHTNKRGRISQKESKKR